jgi:asparagine synthase (glutamine-hydrolysing)
MMAVLEHRGPDDRSVWIGDELALGHTRLSILDPSPRGRQPFVTADGAGVIVFNGEVYNFKELRLRLEDEGVTFRSGTDTEVVLNALHNWGVVAAVRQLNGMFALAYFDRRDGSLWLARDRMGIKPLFLARSASGMSFASEQKALLARPHARRSPDLLALTSLLLYERFNGTQTPYEEVENFPPGTVLRYRQGREDWHTYFDLLRDVDLDCVRDDTRPIADSLARLERSLTHSVQQHLISDVPVATMCSGGLDSGLVTAIAARQRRNLVSYVADIDGMHGEECRRARLVGKAVGVEIRPVPVDRNQFLTALPEATRANDQPLFFAQDVAAMLVAEQVRRDGFKVLLTGDGADELFGGYPWYEHAYRHWHRLAQRARWIPDSSATRWLGRWIPAVMPVDLDRECQAYQLTDTDIEYVSTSFNTVFAGGLTRTLRQRAMFVKLAELPLPARAFLSRNFEDVYIHLRECINTLDKMTMHHGVEARLPFLENDLMALGFGLPVSHKFARGKRKPLVQGLGARHLPRSVVDLPKIGFAMPDRMWRGLERLLIGGRLAEVLKLPNDQSAEMSQLLTRKPRYLFRLIGIEIWLRVCVSGEQVETVAGELLSVAGVGRPAS